jgi:hypothetical protein
MAACSSEDAFIIEVDTETYYTAKGGTGSPDAVRKRLKVA